MAALESTILQAFALFERHGFTKEFEHYDAQAFGNEVLIYVSSELALKFVKDRSEISVDVGAADGSSWHMMPRLFEYLHVADNLYGPADAILLIRHAHLLEENYEMISNLFSHERLAETEAELRRFGKLKAEELFPSDDAGEYGPH